jgi:hypothetical protein
MKVNDRVIFETFNGCTAGKYEGTIWTIDGDIVSIRTDHGTYFLRRKNIIEVINEKKV